MMKTATTMTLNHRTTMMTSSKLSYRCNLTAGSERREGNLPFVLDCTLVIYSLGQRRCLLVHPTVGHSLDYHNFFHMFFQDGLRFVDGVDSLQTFQQFRFLR